MECVLFVCRTSTRLCASSSMYVLHLGAERDATENIWEDSKETVYFSANVILLLLRSLKNCAVLSFKFFLNFLPKNVLAHRTILKIFIFKSY